MWALAGVLGAVGLLAWTCQGGESEPGRDAGAAEAPSPPAPPSAMPTVTVTTTARPEPEQAGGPCDRGGLVANMSVVKNVFAGPERPEFRVTVVSTGEGSCAFDTGALEVRITSGADRVWSSARCRKGAAPTATLRRGIPYVDDVVWDRRRGCKGAVRARPGTYVATLRGAPARKQVFTLR
ncbi:hypothetical protein GWI34_07600 [Actinomadura sp. DSM 109109]|nr:hypothetical protein [Actinomadura lepetitiana]